MKLLNDNVLFEFTVEQGGWRDADPDCRYDSDSYSGPLFRIVVRCRKFQAPIRRPVAAAEQSLDLPLTALLSSDDDRSSTMSRILEQFEVPPRIGDQMAEHFRFFVERLARRIDGGGREIPVSVRLDVKVLSPETAAGIRARMELARTVAAPRPRREEDEEAVPARRSSIEALEKVRIGDEGGGGGRECAICLEELSVGVEVARMPCGHLYHCGCIVEWLQRTHLCPFCRFKMPC